MRMITRVAGATILALSAVLVTACGAGQTGSVPTATVTSPPVTVVSSAPPVTATVTAPLSSRRSPPPTTSSAAPPTQDFPSDAEIRAETMDAFTVVNTYWSNVFAGWHGNYGEPITWEVSRLYHGDGFYDSSRGEDFICGDDPLGPMNASFCGSPAVITGTFAWDMALFRQEELIGDAPIYAIVAHEVGHAAQNRFLHDNEDGASPPQQDTVHYEQQADCLAGAALAKAEQDGYLTVEPGDLDEIVTFISTMEGGGDHGDAADRLTQFRRGYATGDVETCLWNQGVPPDAG